MRLQAAQYSPRGDGLKSPSARQDLSGDASERRPGLLGLILVFLLVYAAAFLTLFPVHQLWSWVEIHIPEQQRSAVTALRGTPWRGEAQVFVIGGQGPGTLAWTWQPQALLRGRLEYALEYTLENTRVETRGGTGEAGLDSARGAPRGVMPASARDPEPRKGYFRAKLSVGLRTIEVRNLSAMLELADWNGLLDIPVLMDGRVELESSQIALNHGFEVQALDARIVWRNAALGFPQVSALGNYRAELSDLEGGIRVRVSSGPGAQLGVEGDVSWQPSGLVQVDLLLSPTEALALPMRGAVESVGHPDGQGRVRLRFEQRI